MEGIFEPHENSTCEIPDRGRRPYRRANRETRRDHSIFHIAAKNPQEPHVANDVHPSAVQEHAGEQRNERLREVDVMRVHERVLNSEGIRPYVIDERLARFWRQRELIEEARKFAAIKSNVITGDGTPGRECPSAESRCPRGDCRFSIERGQHSLLLARPEVVLQLRKAASDLSPRFGEIPISFNWADSTAGSGSLAIERGRGSN